MLKGLMLLMIVPVLVVIVALMLIETEMLSSAAEVEPAEPQIELWGDIDCGAGVTSVDALKLLRHIAALEIIYQTKECPRIATSIEVIPLLVPTRVLLDSAGE